jgi:hypothetical protein
MRGNDANRAVAELAASRHGAYARRLAATVGFTKAMAATRLRRGDLTEPVPGVLLISGTPMTFRTRLSIAVQAAGGTVASHRAAAHLHGFEDFDIAPLESRSHVVGTRRSRASSCIGRNVWSPATSPSSTASR